MADGHAWRVLSGCKALEDVPQEIPRLPEQRIRLLDVPFQLRERVGATEEVRGRREGEEGGGGRVGRGTGRPPEGDALRLPLLLGGGDGKGERVGNTTQETRRSELSAESLAPERVHGSVAARDDGEDARR